LCFVRRPFVHGAQQLSDEADGVRLDVIVGAAGDELSDALF